MTRAKLHCSNHFYVFFTVNAYRGLSSPHQLLNIQYRIFKKRRDSTEDKFFQRNRDIQTIVADYHRVNRL